MCVLDQTRCCKTTAFTDCGLGTEHVLQCSIQADMGKGAAYSSSFSNTDNTVQLPHTAEGRLQSSVLVLKQDTPNGFMDVLSR
jgi:hypothetical protein